MKSIKEFAFSDLPPGIAGPYAAFLLVFQSAPQSINNGYGIGLPKTSRSPHKVLWSKCLCSLKIHMLKPSAQSDGFRRWDHWEMTKS